MKMRNEEIEFTFCVAYLFFKARHYFLNSQFGSWFIFPTTYACSGWSEDQFNFLWPVAWHDPYYGTSGKSYKSLLFMIESEFRFFPRYGP